MDRLAEEIKNLVENGLFPNPTVMLIQLLATFILFFVIKKLVWDSVTKLLEQRAQAVVSELDNAKQANNDANELKDKFEQELVNAKDTAKTIIDNASKQANDKKETVLTEARQEAQIIKNKSLNDIEREKQKALEEAKGYIVDIALAAAEKIVKNEIDETKNTQLINEFISEVGE